jgi:hypothetical protein
MKTARTPIWPLVRIELGIGVTPPIIQFLAVGYIVFVWILLSVFPLLVLMRLCKGNLAEFFTSFGDMLSAVPLWWLMIAAFLNGRIFPVLAGSYSPFSAETPAGSLISLSHEFVLSRAIDRRTLFRVRQGVGLFLMLLPLVIGWLLWHGSPVVYFGPDAVGGGIDSVRARQYEWDFVNRIATPAALPNGSFPIDPGGPLFGGWVLSAGVFGMFLAQGFCAFLARHIRPGRWTLATLLCVPFLLTWVLLDHPQSWQGRWVEGSFLLFKAHWPWVLLGIAVFAVAVQFYSERTFVESEVP